VRRVQTEAEMSRFRPKDLYLSGGVSVVKNLNEENRKMVVELGPESLFALKRLAEVIERLDPRLKEPGVKPGQPCPPNHHDAIEELQESESVPIRLATARPAENKHPQSPYLNVEEAAAYLRVSPKSIYAQVERGNLKPGRGPRRRLMFTKEGLDRYVQRRSLRA
jgi:hypothetical protein